MNIKKTLFLFYISTLFFQSIICNSRYSQRRNERTDCTHGTKAINPDGYMKNNNPIKHNRDRHQQKSITKYSERRNDRTSKITDTSGLTFYPLDPNGFANNK